MAIDYEPTDRWLALVLFTRQFSTMVDAGISLVRCLQILEQNAAPPYDEAARVIRSQVEEGHILSSLMAALPDQFTPFYVKMVRVGEVGGILEESLRYLADILEDAWSLSRQSRQVNRIAWLFFRTSQHPKYPPPEDWCELKNSQHTFLLMLFCRSLGMMLSAGVPPKMALEVASDLLPATQREAVRAVAQGDLTENVAGKLAAIGFLPSLVTQLMEAGESDGAFDQKMEKAALVYERELKCRLM
jgi:type II secretory pathway component PulF